MNTLKNVHSLKFTSYNCSESRAAFQIFKSSCCWKGTLRRLDTEHLSLMHRTISRRYLPPTGKSKWSTCQWTGCTHTCPGATPMWSLRRLKKPRRPSNTWTAVGEHVHINPSVSQDYTGRECWSWVLSVPYAVDRSDWWAGNHCLCCIASENPTPTSQTLSSSQNASTSAYVASQPAPHEEKVSLKASLLWGHISGL